MATGREQFAKYAPLIRVGVAILSLLPRTLVESGWWGVCYLPGKLGIGIRYMFAKRLCARCGDNVLIGPGVFVDHWQNLSFGTNVTLHRNSYVDARGGIRIGDNVSIAHASSLVAFEHSYNQTHVPIKYNPLVLAPIVIESDVWIGCGVRVLSGVTIVSRSIIAAGAVVTRGEKTSGIYGGVPAKCIKPLPSATGNTNRMMSAAPVVA